MEVSQLFLSETVDFSFCQSCPLHVLLTEQCYTFFSSLTFNRFRLSLLPVSMSEDHEGWVYYFISCNGNHLLCSSISLRLSYLVNNILKNVLINVCYSLPRCGGIQESLIRILLGIDILQVSIFAACFLFFSHSNVMIKTKIQ